MVSLLVVTNPRVDVLTYTAWRLYGLPARGHRLGDCAGHRPPQ